LKDFFSVQNGWVGIIGHGLVSNDAKQWHEVGDEYPRHFVAEHQDFGFDVVCFDDVIRTFKYFKFTIDIIDTLSDYDKCYLEKIYY